tara:strand:- start:12955 stop:14460 length:1506 start_codon:yes stop_codon:yes gene_type:complete
MIISEGRATFESGYKNRSKDIILRWREQDETGAWVRKEKIDKEFKPYGFVDPRRIYDKVGENPYSPSSYRQLKIYEVEDAAKRYRGVIDKDCNAVNAQGDKLWKITFNSPSTMDRFRWKYSHDANNQIKSSFDGTYEFDVPYTDRYMIDNMDEIHRFKPRLVFIDLESTQFTDEEHGPRYPYLRREGHGMRGYQEINTIGCYDNFSETYVQWFQHPEIPTEDEVHRDGKLEKFDEHLVEVRRFADEKSMLQDFVEWVELIDPDMFLAWGMGFYDLPTLYTRLEATGVGADMLSPSTLGFHQHCGDVNKNGQYGWTTQPLIGRVVVSLDRLFARVFKDASNQDLPSNKLDVVGEYTLGRGKTDWKPDFYAKDYIKDEWNFLYYNYRDVELMRQIDEKYNIIEGQMALQELCVSSFTSTFYGTNFARVYFMRKADFKQHTGMRMRPKDPRTDEDDKIEGARVLDPHELETVGMHKNVVILDYAGLYPAMMQAYNTSWETKVIE